MITLGAFLILGDLGRVVIWLRIQLLPALCFFLLLGPFNSLIAFGRLRNAALLTCTLGALMGADDLGRVQTMQRWLQMAWGSSISTGLPWLLPEARTIHFSSIFPETRQARGSVA